MMKRGAGDWEKRGDGEWEKRETVCVPFLRLSPSPTLRFSRTEGKVALLSGVCYISQSGRNNP